LGLGFGRAFGRFGGRARWLCGLGGQEQDGQDGPRSGDASGDEEEKPLRLEIIPPSSKSPLEDGDRPKVGVGAKGEGDGVHGSDPEPNADDSES